MKKFIVETYYTCTFKTVHSLENLNDHELSKIDSRNDGEVETLDSSELISKSERNFLHIFSHDVEPDLQGKNPIFTEDNFLTAPALLNAWKISLAL